MSSAPLDINEDHGLLSWQGPSDSWSQTPPTPPTVNPPGNQTNAEGDNVSLPSAPAIPTAIR